MKIKIDEKALTKAMQDIARTYDRGFEDLRARYTGKPVAEIKPAVQQLFRSNGDKISDPELISQGKRVRMQMK